VGGGDDAGQVGNRADRVGGGGDRDPARPLAEDRLDGARGQLQRSLLGLGEAHARAGARRGDRPRGDVGVVVQERADDLVAGRQRAAGRGREAHRQRRHRRAEHDAPWIGAEQRADSRARAVDELVDALRGTERAAVVGVVARSHEGRHGLDRVVDHLRAGGAVEARPAVCQAREAVAVHGGHPR